VPQVARCVLGETRAGEPEPREDGDMFTLLAQTVPIDLDEVVDTSNVTEWDLVAGVASVFVAAILGRTLAVLVRRGAGRTSLPPNIVDLAATVVMWTVATTGVVVGLTFVGLNATPLWFLLLLFVAMFVVGGRALFEGFGAGVMLQARAPFTPGDLVDLGDQRGVVLEVNSRTVILDTIDGRRIHIPNQRVLNDDIVNLSIRRGRLSEIALDVTYDTDLDRACQVAIEAAETADGQLPDHPPTTTVSSFDASAVRITLRIWHPPDLQSEWGAVDAASRAVHVAYADHDIEFAFPQQTLWWGADQ